MMMKAVNRMAYERIPLMQGTQIILGNTYYRIDSIIGSGGSAIVYEASYPDQMNQDYVHKVLIREFFPYDKRGLIYRDERGYICFDESRREVMEKQKAYFYRGNQINLELMKNHPHNVSYNMNTYEAYGSFYTIMAMHGGQVLEDILHHKNRNVMTLRQQIKIIQQILKALGPFHELRILHIDISPDNILIFDDCAMLIDYNSAFYLDESVDDFDFYVKEGYAAPEILLGNYNKINFCTDLFSVCAVLFRMIVGRRLTEQEYRSRNLLQTIFHETDMADKEKENVTRFLGFLLMKGLHILPQKRYQTTGEMMTDLEELLARIDEEDRTENNLSENVSDENDTFQGIHKGKTGQSAVTHNRKTGQSAVTYHRKIGRSVMMMSACLLVGFAVILLAYMVIRSKFWLVRAEAFGNSNSNIYNEGKYLLLPEQYEYYVDVEGNLCICTFDPVDKIFPIDQAEIIYEVQNGDSVKFLNQAEDKIYFVHSDMSTGADQLMCMSLDGSNQEIVSTLEAGKGGDFYNYVKLSDGREYIYYLLGKELEDESFEATDICRINLTDRKTEKIISGDIQWFNLTEDALYYIDYYEENAQEQDIKEQSTQEQDIKEQSTQEQDIKEQSTQEQSTQEQDTEEADYEPEYNTVLHKTDLTGRHDQVIDDSSHFALGFIEGDVAYLFSLDYVHEGLVAYDLKKDAGDKAAQESFNYTGIFDVDVYNAQFAYDDGWIYYSPFDSTELHKIRTDGTNDQMVCEGICIGEINCQDDYIMLTPLSEESMEVATEESSDESDTEEDIQEEKILLISKDGEDRIEIE